jgi:hypothetical protein
MLGSSAFTLTTANASNGKFSIMFTMVEQLTQSFEFPGRLERCAGCFPELPSFAIGQAGQHECWESVSTLPTERGQKKHSEKVKLESARE